MSLRACKRASMPLLTRCSKWKISDSRCLRGKTSACSSGRFDFALPPLWPVSGGSSSQDMRPLVCIYARIRRSGGSDQSTAYCGAPIAPGVFAPAREKRSRRCQTRMRQVRSLVRRYWTVVMGRRWYDEHDNDACRPPLSDREDCTR